MTSPASNEGSQPLTQPIAGDVYSVASRAYDVIHHRESHPVVVLSPIAGTDDWHVWPRTSKMDRPGIDHAPNLALKLDRPGRFCGRDVARLSRLVFLDPKLATYRGTLEPEMFTKLMNWWLS